MIRLLTLLALVLSACSENNLASGGGGAGGAAKATIVQGNETQNGGSSVKVGEDRYELAALHYAEAPFHRFVPDAGLRTFVADARSFLARHLRVLPQHDGRSFFDDLLDDRSFEYRFVESLPEDCRFLRRNQIASPRAMGNIACTQGHITYINPKEWLKLRRAGDEAATVAAMGFLLIQERLHAVDPHEPYAVKAPLLQALQILLTKLKPALDAMESNNAYEENFRFSDAELKTLNDFDRHLRQLFNDDPALAGLRLRFTPEGGILVSEGVPAGFETGWLLKGGVKVGLGSAIYGQSTEKNFRPSIIQGRDFEIQRSRLVFYGRIRLQGYRAQIRNSNLYRMRASRSRPSALSFVKVELSNLKGLLLSPTTHAITFGGGALPSSIQGDGDFFRSRVFDAPSVLIIRDQEQFDSTWHRIDPDSV